MAARLAPVAARMTPKQWALVLDAVASQRDALAGDNHEGEHDEQLAELELILKRIPRVRQ
jgi:hypothetical protein